MAITKEKKAEILQELIDKFGRSKTVVFSDYRGLDVSSISDLRSRLREGGAECKVAKKTLMRLAAKETNIGELSDDIMEGPVSATFSYEDELAGLQILFKFSKENENLKLLGGIVDGKLMGAEEIIQLAKLPSKDELIAKLIGSMNAPISGTVGILGNLIGGFVRVLNAYKDTLPAEAIETEDTPAPEEKPADTAEPLGNAVGAGHVQPTDEPTADEPEPSTDQPTEPAPKEPKTEDAPADEPKEETPPADEPGDAPADEEDKKEEA